VLLIIIISFCFSPFSFYVSKEMDKLEKQRIKEDDYLEKLTKRVMKLKKSSFLENVSEQTFLG
jgi:hypothetical protein